MLVSDERLQQQVGSLSGGWKMKLELARAMLMKADVLLLMNLQIIWMLLMSNGYKII